MQSPRMGAAYEFPPMTPPHQRTPATPSSDPPSTAPPTQDPRQPHRTRLRYGGAFISTSRVGGERGRSRVGGVTWGYGGVTCRCYRGSRGGHEGPHKGYVGSRGGANRGHVGSRVGHVVSRGGHVVSRGGLGAVLVVGGAVDEIGQHGGCGVLGGTEGGGSHKAPPKRPINPPNCP